MDTKEEHMLYDGAGPAVGMNTTSVKDCAVVLGLMYNGKLVSEEADTEMLEILKKQTRNHKIPALLPEDTVVAHKTSEFSQSELDVGIVYSPACDYIICISVTDFGNCDTQSTFAEISEITYEFFNRQF